MFKQLARKTTLETHLCAQSLFQNDKITLSYTTLLVHS